MCSCTKVANQVNGYIKTHSSFCLYSLYFVWKFCVFVDFSCTFQSQNNTNHTDQRLNVDGHRNGIGNSYTQKKKIVGLAKPTNNTSKLLKLHSSNAMNLLRILSIFDLTQFNRPHRTKKMPQFHVAKIVAFHFGFDTHSFDA